MWDYSPGPNLPLNENIFPTLVRVPSDAANAGKAGKAGKQTSFKNYAGKAGENTTFSHATTGKAENLRLVNTVCINQNHKNYSTFSIVITTLYPLPTKVFTYFRCF